MHKVLLLKDLLDMVVTSARIGEYIELDPATRYAIYTNHPMAFEYTIQVKSPRVRGGEDLTLEFTQHTALLCDAEVFRALRIADQVRYRLTFIDTATGGKIFEQPEKQAAFTPNGGKPMPTLAQAFEDLDKIPHQPGNFGRRRQDGFTPNTSKKVPPAKSRPVKQPAMIMRTAAYKPGPDAVTPEGRAVFDYLNKGCYWEEGQEGFWRSGGLREVTNTLPFPVKMICAGYRRAEFLEALDRVQSRLKPKVFRGYSPNRWTGEFNGSAEYQVDGWKWPEGYRTYLAAGVLPSREFYNFITGRYLKALPSFAKFD